jgi:hypothetical protein
MAQPLSKKRNQTVAGLTNGDDEDKRSKAVQGSGFNVQRRIPTLNRAEGVPSLLQGSTLRLRFNCGIGLNLVEP